MLKCIMASWQNNRLTDIVDFLIRTTQKKSPRGLLVIPLVYFKKTSKELIVESIKVPQGVGSGVGV